MMKPSLKPINCLILFFSSNRERCIIKSTLNAWVNRLAAPGVGKHYKKILFLSIRGLIVTGK